MYQLYTRRDWSIDRTWNHSKQLSSPNTLQAVANEDTYGTVGVREGRTRRHRMDTPRRARMTIWHTTIVSKTPIRLELNDAPFHRSTAEVVTRQASPHGHAVPFAPIYVKSMKWLILIYKNVFNYFQIINRLYKHGLTYCDSRGSMRVFETDPQKLLHTCYVYWFFLFLYWMTIKEIILFYQSVCVFAGWGLIVMRLNVRRVRPSTYVGMTYERNKWHMGCELMWKM